MRNGNSGIIGAIVVLMALACLWLFCESYQLPFQNEVTVYNLSCYGDSENGKCITNIQVTYKALVDSQRVIAIVENPRSSPERLENCTVWDSRNWECHQSDARDFEYRRKMQEGKYSEGTYSEGKDLNKIFGGVIYGVPKWRYYLVWLGEKLR